VAASEAVAVYWGPDLVLLYNDAWRTFINDKHPDALGRPGREVFPELWDVVGPKLAAVLAGEGAEVDRGRRLPLDRGAGVEDAWFDYSFNPIPVADGSIGGVFNVGVDVTERRRAEAALRERADLDAFRVALSDALRSLADPDEVQQTALRLLGDRLAADLAYYYEYDADADVGVIHHDYRRDGGPSVVGRYALAEFPESHRLVADARTVSIPDVAADDRLAAAERDNFLALDVGAWLFVPLVKSGRLVAVCTVGHATPREWTTADATVVEETAERTWAAVERARAEQALRASEERLRRANDALERLNAASRELLDADVDGIRDRVADLAGAVLGVDYTALWRYDEVRGDLVAHARYVADGVDPAAVRLPDGFEGEIRAAFVGDRVAVFDEVAVAGADDEGVLAMRSGLLVPLGRHGVVCAGSTRPGAFDERTVDLAETLAATVETALDRADSERELEERNAELTRLDRLNALIRGIDQALVEADTVDAIDAAVTERLAAADPFGFAWIGAYDPETDAIVPRAWAGVDAAVVEALAPSPDAGDDPVVTAVREGTVQVVADVAVDARAAPWREAALERGVRSCVAVPLTYEGSPYGVVAAYGVRPGRDERDVAVLAELGDTVAHAINAVETKTTLRTDSVVELTLTTAAATTPLCRLARETGCVIALEGFVPGAGDDVTTFLTVSDPGPDGDGDATREAGADAVDAVAGFVTAAERSLGVVAVTRLTDADDETLFELRTSEPTLPALFVAAGAVVRSLSVEAGDATAVVDLPTADDVRGFVDRVRRVAPDVELSARRTRTRRLETRQTLREAFVGGLTDRQREVLHTAYRSGYFESPRVRSGTDLAATIGISGSTFSQHLRAAERTLCELVFDD
jgi:GAF domain-containing protein/predicted DNA binding protein